LKKRCIFLIYFHTLTLFVLNKLLSLTPGDAYDIDDNELATERHGALAGDVCDRGRGSRPCLYHADLVLALPAHRGNW